MILTLCKPQLPLESPASSCTSACDPRQHRTETHNLEECVLQIFPYSEVQLYPPRHARDESFYRHLRDGNPKGLRATLLPRKRLAHHCDRPRQGLDDRLLEFLAGQTPFCRLQAPMMAPVFWLLLDFGLPSSL